MTLFRKLMHHGVMDLYSWWQWFPSFVLMNFLFYAISNNILFTCYHQSKVWGVRGPEWEIHCKCNVKLVDKVLLLVYCLFCPVDWHSRPDLQINLFSHYSREQRVTGILVFLLTGLSVFMAPILKVKLQHLNSSMEMWITVCLF